MRNLVVPIIRETSRYSGCPFFHVLQFSYYLGKYTLGPPTILVLHSAKYDTVKVGERCHSSIQCATGVLKTNLSRRKGRLIGELQQAIHDRTVEEPSMRGPELLSVRVDSKVPKMK